MDNQQPRPISYAPRYSIDKLGKVYGVKDTELKTFLDKYGYPSVTFWKPTSRSKFNKNVHRLVAEAFIPNTLGLPEINHIDGDKTNNHVSNLEWVTGQENKNHAVAYNLVAHGESSGVSVLTEEDVHQIFGLMCACPFISEVTIADLLNKNHQTVGDVMRGNTWERVSFIYNVGTEYGNKRRRYFLRQEIEEIIKLSLKDTILKYHISTSTICSIKRYPDKFDIGKVHRLGASRRNTCSETGDTNKPVKI